MVNLRKILISVSFMSIVTIYFYPIMFLLDFQAFFISYSLVIMAFLFIPAFYFGLKHTTSFWVNENLKIFGFAITFIIYLACMGWLILNFFIFSQAFRILIWQNFYSIPLISLTTAPLSHMFYKLSQNSINLPIDEKKRSNKKYFYKTVVLGVIQASPFPIFGLAVINFWFFLFFWVVITSLSIICAKCL